MRIFLILILFCASVSVGYGADTPVPARALLVQAILADGDAQAGFIVKLGDTDDPALVKEVLKDWVEGGVYLHTGADGKMIPFIIKDEGNVEIETGKVITATENTPVDTDSHLRKQIRSTLELLALVDPSPALRKSAVMKLGMTQRADYVPLLQGRLDKETDSTVRQALNEAIAIIGLGSSDPTVQIDSIDKLVTLDSLASVDLITSLSTSTSADPKVCTEAKKALVALNNYLFWVNFYGTIFRGLSAGSILLIAALGLAITFGLMGVINMAHGELIATGAYTTYITQILFVSWFGPAGLNWYFIFAIPLSFCTAALVGLILERSIIQFLYSRPLESLLATSGVSLVLQQAFHYYNPANLDVESPSWLLGNITIYDVVLGYNRIFVICFAAAIIFFTWLLLTKSPIGLLIRAVTQNRHMAACVGVRTDVVNMATFAFGSGLAGLAGAFLSQIGNVGPNMGQSYIIDCFMTVVVGGVGKLVGTICSALGIGMSGQALQEILQNPVFGQIIVLVAIILFLQWKPGGLFPSRGRGLED